ncbi:cupredoxin family copper-binding protein [Amycolatopsis stemonae]
MRRAVLLAVIGLVAVATPARAAGQQVMMENYAFSPAALTVHVGDTVTWVQHDQAPHDATTTSAPAAFRSPQLSQGQSWSYTFRTPGTYAYYCSVHPDMRAAVTVLPVATTAPQAKPTRAPVTPSSAKRSTAASGPPTTSAVAAAPPTTEEATPPPAVAQQAAGPSLDPMLLVAGLVTGIAVLCLLLLGSRRAS